MTRSSILLALLTALLAVTAAGHGQVRNEAAPDAGGAGTELPVSRVILFTSGIGYFEHSGTVVGDSEIELSIPAEDMDDLLQSLVLQDFDGGTIRPVRYASRDPLARILGSYSLDLSGDPTLASLLSQARGEPVQLQTSQAIEGTIVNVERVEVPKEEQRTYLTLATATGLRRIDLAEVRELRFARSEVQEELDAALAAVARYRGTDDKAVRLRFSGEGERRVSVGYVREMPVWKTSYRLLLGDDGSAEVQGWAIFDNPTDLDLVDVEVSFVAGQPVSFIPDLYEPNYRERPRVQAAPAPDVTPRAFAADSFAREADQAEAAAAMRLAAPSPALQLSGAGVSAMAAGSQTGATFEYRVSEPVSVERHQSAMIPIVDQRVAARRLSIFDAGTHPSHPLRGVRLQNDTGLHLAAGPVSVFDSGGFTGNALITDIVAGDSRVLAYAVDLEVEVGTRSDSEPEAVVAVAIRNGVLETVLSQRLTTRYDVTSRGEAARFLVIEHPRRNDFEVVAPQPPATTLESFRFGIAIGASAAGNGAAGEGAAGEGAAGDGTVPTHLTCEPGGECQLTVVMERTLTRSLAIANLSPDQIGFYLENVDVSETDRRTLSDILELEERIVAFDRDLAEVRDRVAAIHGDQSRIRQNMAGLERNSSLYRRYVADLEEQENELNELAQEEELLAEGRRELQEQLDTLLSNLAG